MAGKGCAVSLKSVLLEALKESWPAWGCIDAAPRLSAHWRDARAPERFNILRFGVGVPARAFIVADSYTERPKMDSSRPIMAKGVWHGGTARMISKEPGEAAPAQ